MRIQANPTALSSYGINLEDLRNAISGANVNQAKGSFDGPAQAYQIGANDQLLNSTDYANLIVAYKNNGPVRLSDVAEGGGRNRKQPGGGLGQPRARPPSSSRRSSSTSSVSRARTSSPWSTGSPRCCRSCGQSLPGAVNIQTISDRTGTIRASVADVKFELMLTIALVVGVIFLFLRNLPATFIAGARRAALARRHVRRDVLLRLLDQQPDADGADHLDRLRGRRRRSS